MLQSPKIYKSFLKTIVREGVFSEEELQRDSCPVADKEMKDIQEGKRIDHRLPYLARISGKGGVGYEEVRNISLLEHLTSVARGAVVFAEQDLCAAGYSNCETLNNRLARIVVVGFLHDADKMVNRGRSLLDCDMIEELMNRYCVHKFLHEWGADVCPEWIRAMIDQVEVTRAGRLVPGGFNLSVDEQIDASYIQCADRLEAKFLTDGPQAALDELNVFAEKRFRVKDSVKDRWRVIDLFQPHIPFILEALHTGFSLGCREIAGISPLFETHQDGRLIVAVPSDPKQFNEILNHALEEVKRRFKIIPRVSVNNRLAIGLHDARTDVKELRDTITEDKKIRYKVLAMDHSGLVSEDYKLRSILEDAVEDMDFSVSWRPEEKISGASDWPLPGSEDSIHEEVFGNARVISVTLKCKQPDNKALAGETPDSAFREVELLEKLDNYSAKIPDEIRCHSDDNTRRSLISLLAAGHCLNCNSVNQEILGNNGLVNLWLEGHENRKGINEAIPDNLTEKLVQPVREMLEQALNNRFVEGNENAPRRCHFTNAPVEEDSRYASKTEGIYALKVSAFSGRQGRPESHRKVESGTYLSPIVRTEYKLRFHDNNGKDGRALSFQLSSPSVSGLFASLTLDTDTRITEISTYELRRTLNPRKSKITFNAVDCFEKRILIGRYENQEPGLAEAIETLLRIVEASLRTGRPIHVFQGLPYEVRDRVYFDGLPHVIELGLGKKGFRIEELEFIRDKLRIWSQVSKTPGLGIGLAADIMDPETRLGALCDAVNRLERMGENNLIQLKIELFEQAKELLMTEVKYSPILRFAHAMTGFQSGPHSESSQSDRTRGMRLALEVLDGLNKFGTMDSESMICAVKAEIENAAERETNKQYTKRYDGDPTHQEALTRAAEIFAYEVWPVVFKKSVPDSKSRRLAVSIYRVAFERGHQRRKNGEIVFPSKSKN